MLYEPLIKNWRIVDVIEDKEIHVVPNNDEIEHEDNCSCWCSPFHDINPNYDDGEWKVMVHRSADGREQDE